MLPKVGDLIAKRLTRSELGSVRRGDLSDCTRLRFFMEMPESVRGKLLAIAQPVRTAANVVLFRQGDDHIDGYYVIVQGTVKIEQKMA